MGGRHDGSVDLEPTQLEGPASVLRFGRIPALDWHAHAVIDPTTYAIGFSDADTGVWMAGSVLRAWRPRPICHQSRFHNSGGGWQFREPAASPVWVWMPVPAAGHEITRGRSRSMLVLMWT